MDVHDEENVAKPESLRRKLADAVRSVQWSYAIFWALSTTQHGVLEWGEGYYNGDIKARKTVHSKDLDAHGLGLQRSEQLRKLYQSLLEDESEPGTKRPSGGLSLEDLSDLEWYYLVCMSFTFNFGQSLPGRALATGKPIWLLDAQCADSKVFSRSLLAKSASVQTVLCFPHTGGVIELGITDLVSEDLNLIQHIKTTLIEVVKPICSEEHSYASYSANYGDYNTGMKVTGYCHEAVDTIYFPRISPSGEETRLDIDISIGSPNDFSNDCCYNAEDSLMLENTTSPFQNWDLLEEYMSQPLQDLTSFYGCLPQNFGSQEEPMLSTNGENTEILHSETLQDLSSSKIMNDTRYRSTLSVILDNTSQSFTDQNTSFYGFKSSFGPWKKDFMVHDSIIEGSQETLKTILFKVPVMHSNSTLRSLEKGERVYPLKPQACHPYILNSTYEERTDNGMLCSSEENTESEHYMVLKSMLPSIAETDETSILMDTIEYMKELEAKVDELESCIDFKGSSTMKDLDLLEHTSDNYERVEDQQTPLVTTRKASEIFKSNPDLSAAIQTDISSLTVNVDIIGQEVLIKMRWPWREHLLLDIMEAANNLNLETCTVQSSTVNGILSLFLKSKIQGEAFASEENIKEALSRTVGMQRDII